jgi:hypothetical protein
MIDLPDFDALYRDDPDPWQVRSSFYEQRKLDIVLAGLQRPRYRSAWDPACGVGELRTRPTSRSGWARSRRSAASRPCRTARSTGSPRRSAPPG